MSNKAVRIFVVSCFCVILASTALQARKPNVIFIMVDDLGWMDLACQGNKVVDTPNIDRFAAEGMRFTSAYSAAPVCTPTRAAVLTGKSPARLHITTHAPGGFLPKTSKFLPAKTLIDLPLEHLTIAERLKEAGYRNAFLGKWHLAGDSRRGAKGRGNVEFHPEAQGFDVNIGGCAYGGPPTYFDPYRIHTLAPRKKGEYLPDRLVDETISFIRKNRDKPFFVNLWPYTVHWPVEAPAKLVEKYSKLKDPWMRNHGYAAMIEAMDTAFGRLFAELKNLGLEKDTLVMLTSDNGPFLGVAGCEPLREGKGYLYEGGIRVPLMVRWPGRVRAGSTCDTPVISMDYYPTILAALGLSRRGGEAPDGESLLPLLEEKKGFKEKPLYFHFPNFSWHMKNRLGGAVRDGKYKLIEWYDDNSFELYDLAADIGEKKDLSKKMPQKAAELLGKLRAWRKSSGAWMPRKRES
ncbi:MAG: sulfatase [Planctomycetota bacterium]